MTAPDKYKLAFEISPVPLLLASYSGEILLTNSLLDQLFEYNPHELVGQSVDILVPDGTRHQHKAYRNKYFDNPEKRKMGQGRDLRGLKKNDAEFPVELGLEPIDLDGQPCALVVAIDIRERLEQEHNLKTAMNAAASSITMVDAEQNIVFANKSTLILFGYEHQELMNKPIELIIPAKIQRKIEQNQQQVKTPNQENSPTQDTNLWVKHKSGRNIAVEIEMTPVVYDDSTSTMYTIVDLSEKNKAAKDLAKKSKELAAANLELTQFAYSASHDLKAPLTSIAGLINICLEDLEDGDLEEVKSNLKKCADITTRSAKKVEDILKIARISHDVSLSEPTNLKQSIEQVWLDLSGVNPKNIQFLLDLQHQDPIDLEPQTFKVILENLLSNAIRYIDNGKDTHSIQVNTKREENNLVLGVKDNGIGIPAAHQQAVFQMFKKIDERSQDGLGMSLVKKQIDRLNGSIKFDSTEGLGTEFTVTFPLIHGEADEHSNSDSR